MEQGRAGLALHCGTSRLLLGRLYGLAYYGL